MPYVMDWPPKRIVALAVAGLASVALVAGPPRSPRTESIRG